MQETRIDQARQFTPAPLSPEQETTEAGTIEPGVDPESVDDAFGAQMILKDQEKLRPFSAFAELSAFFTNNVALTKVQPQEDSFLVANFGFGYTRDFAPGWNISIAGRYAMFRYNEFNVLDFDSVDATAAVSWSPSQWKGVSLFARYGFTSLIARTTDDEFFQNHAVAVGAQKIFAISRTHAAYLGASAQWAYSEPELAQRDEYSAYAGYRWLATEDISVGAMYRYGYFVYREEGDRRDHNQTASLNLRYEPVEWLAFSGTAFGTWNRSNLEVFDYDVFNAGGGISVQLRF